MATSLNDIINIARDPGQGTVAPEAFSSQEGIVRSLNQVLQNKAENDRMKYGMFMDNLKGVYKELGDLQGLKVAQADRPYLEKQAGEIFQKIANDPNAFFSGKMADIEQSIGKLRSESTQSVQDNVFDEAHRQYLDREPSLNTPENKSKMDAYFKQPLGQRKPYTLDLPSLWNPAAEAAQANTFIQQKYSRTGLTPDGKFISSETGIAHDPRRFMTVTDQLYRTPDANGQTIEMQVAKRFKSLPPQAQAIYAEKYPDDPIKGFHDEMVKGLISPNQVEKTELKDNPYGLETQKARERLQQMGVKFGYDKILEEMKLGGQKQLALFKESLKTKSKKDQVGALNGMVDTMIDSAIGTAASLSPEEQKLWGVKDGWFKMNVSPKTLSEYSTTKGAGAAKNVSQPDELLVSVDGKKVKAIYYGSGGKVDESKTAEFSIDEFKVRFGKDVLGVSATAKEINADDEDGGEEETSSSSTTVIGSSGKEKIKGF